MAAKRKSDIDALIQEIAKLSPAQRKELLRKANDLESRPSQEEILPGVLDEARRQYPFQPKTKLAEKLYEKRLKMIATGQQPLTQEQIVHEINAQRGLSPEDWL